MTKKEFLLDTLEYYTQDPKGRTCESGGVCGYSSIFLGKQDTSEGCALGRYMSEEFAKFADDSGNSIKRLQGEEGFPEKLKNLPHLFLQDVQTLHDISRYWTDSGLSVDGIKYLEEIMEEWNIQYKEFDKYIKS